MRDLMLLLVHLLTTLARLEVDPILWTGIRHS